MTIWGESDSDEKQERSSSECFMDEKEVTSLSQLPKDDLIKLIKKLNLCLEKHEEQMNEKDMIKRDITEENNKWAAKAMKLEKHMSDVHPRDATLKDENLKPKEEIYMFKTEYLKLMNDLKVVYVSDDEKKKV